MSPFEYHRPDTVDEAVALLETYGGDGKVLAAAWLTAFRFPGGVEA